MAYGSGTLYQRGAKGIWYYQAFVNGTQVGPFSAKTTDRKKAQRELDKLLGKRARGEVTGLKRDRLIVADIVREYLTYADEKLENARDIRYKMEASFLPHRISSILASNLTTEDLRKYRQDRGAQGVKDSTCNREIAYARAAMNRALKAGKVSVLPYFPTTKEDNARQGFLEEPEFLTLLYELPYPLKPFGVCGYYVGMRTGEIVNLEPRDVDLRLGFLTIRKTKNKEPRLVPIFDGPMREWLTWAMRNRKPGQVKLMVWESGSPISKFNFYKKWHAATERAGIAWYIPHDSRRSASRNMRDEGVPKEVRKAVIGHKTDDMDRRYGIVDLQNISVVKEIMSRKTTAKTTAIGSVEKLSA